MEMIKIGAVSKQLGVTTDTIRLYERYGLMKAPDRTKNGYRCYDETAIQKLQFIIRAKTIGFTLKEVQELLLIHQSTQKSCEQIKCRTQEKLQQISEKIDELTKLKMALKTLVRECEKNNPDGLCPIFTLLSNDEEANQ